jgi:hypothetical protein
LSGALVTQSDDGKAQKKHGPPPRSKRELLDAGAAEALTLALRASNDSCDASGGCCLAGKRTWWGCTSCILG